MFYGNYLHVELWHKQCHLPFLNCANTSHMFCCKTWDLVWYYSTVYAENNPSTRASNDWWAPWWMLNSELIVSFPRRTTLICLRMWISHERLFSLHAMFGFLMNPISAFENACVSGKQIQKWRNQCDMYRSRVISYAWEDLFVNSPSRKLRDGIRLLGGGAICGKIPLWSSARAVIA